MPNVTVNVKVSRSKRLAGVFSALACVGHGRRCGQGMGFRPSEATRAALVDLAETMARDEGTERRRR